RDDDEQERLLRDALGALRPGGALIVREIDAGRPLRALAARARDRVARIVKGRPAAAGARRTGPAWARVLEGFELFDVRVLPRRRLRAFGARGRLLDVGAATGAFLREARAAGLDAVGIEPSEAAARVARAAWLDVRATTIEAAELPAGRFDVVTAFDVLEH